MQSRPAPRGGLSMSLGATPRGRRALFSLLYLCEGAPIGFAWFALPTILAANGAKPEEIGILLAMLALPWSAKVVWAPLVDLLRTPRWNLRAWIASSQVVMAVSLLPLALPGALQSPLSALPWLLVHAFAAATQDVAVDALCVRAAPASERGSLNAWMQAGMLTGRSLFGGGALLVRAHLGDGGLVLALAALILCGAVVALAAREPETPAKPLAGRWREIGSGLARAARSRTTWAALVFAATAGAAFEAAGAFAGPMLVAAGMGTEEIGVFLASATVVPAIAGGFVGGRLSDRMGRRLAVAISGAAMASAVLALGVAASSGAGAHAQAGLLALVYLTVGLQTATSYALFMDLTDPALGATQFSAYMGATNVCESWSVGLAGASIGRHGYGTTYAALAAVSLAALAAVPFLVHGPARANAAPKT